VRIRKSLSLIAGLGCLALLAPAQTGESRYSVPALEAFHEVIYPIWHTAYPERDVAMLRRLVPEVDRLAKGVAEVRLPGILIERQDRWAAGLAVFEASVAAFDSAANGTSDQALLDAAEALHSRYEEMVRIVRPLPPELMDFHGALYVIYHTHLPARDYQAIRAAGPDLLAKAESASRAVLSRRFEALKDKYAAGAAALLDSVRELAAVPAGNEAALGPAVEKVHGRYQDLEKVFD
jgi:hypothetical protein